MATGGRRGGQRRGQVEGQTEPIVEPTTSHFGLLHLDLLLISLFCQHLSLVFTCIFIFI